MYFFKRFIVLALFILGSAFSLHEASWEKELKALSATERCILEKFFRIFLNDSQGGYVLFGSKPICVEGVLPNENSCLPMIGLEVHERNILLKEGLKIWHKLPLLSQNYFLHAYRKPSYGWLQVLFINRQQFLKVVRENLSLFQYVLGPKVTPEELFQKILDPEESDSSVFRNDKVLIGIILGFGTDNSLFVSRKESIDEYFYRKKELVPFKPIKLRGREPKKKGSFSYNFIKDYPSFGYSSLVEESDHLENETLLSKELVKTSAPTIPWFGCLKNKGTDKLLNDYLKTQKVIQEVLNSDKFLEKIFARFFEKSKDQPPRPLAEIKKCDLASLIAHSIYSDLDLSETDAFVQGMRAYDQDSTLLSLDEWWHLLDEMRDTERSLEARKNLTKAERFFTDLCKESKLTCLIPEKLYYRKTKEGRGKIVLNHDASIVVNYTISNLDDDVIACSQPDQNSMDLSDLIPGCALAIKGMAIGEEREIWIHPAYAYGETSNIAPNLGMKAIVKLIDILSDGKDDFKFVPFELAAENQSEEKLEKKHRELKQKLAFSLGIKTWAHFKKGQKEGYSLDAVVAAIRNAQSGKKIVTISDSDAEAQLSRLHWDIYQQK